jgi:hypothetical protein
MALPYKSSALNSIEDIVPHCWIMWLSLGLRREHHSTDDRNGHYPARQLITESLFSNGWCIVARSAVVA